MNEQEALSKMVAPGQHRPGKMGGGGVIQIHLTRACTLSCYNCTQGSNLTGKPRFISLESFEIALQSLQGYPYLIALFGGQPTLHPKFPEICSILVRYVPINKRGLWTNALNGHGKVCREVFRPENCNLNVHLDNKAYDEFRSDWPEARPFGLGEDSHHSPVHLAMSDIIDDEGERWKLISKCTINQHWSAMVYEFRGQVRASFCEIAGAQNILHQDDPSWPDTGIPLPQKNGEVSWWKWPIESFADQVRYHCHKCAVPMNLKGELSQSAVGVEKTSPTHADIYAPKRQGRRVEVVTTLEQLGTSRVPRVIDYLRNSKL